MLAVRNHQEFFLQLQNFETGPFKIWGFFWLGHLNLLQKQVIEGHGVDEHLERIFLH